MRYILFLFFIFINIVSGLTQELSYPRIGLGVQANFPAGGLSAKYDFNSTNSGQAVIGLFGPYSSIYGRYIHGFEEKGEKFLLKPYAYGQLGYWSYDVDDYYGHDLTDVYGENFDDNSIGFGFGGGIELTYPEFSENLKYNIEAGINKVDLDYYDFNFMNFGIGLHYYFNF